MKQTFVNESAGIREAGRPIRVAMLCSGLGRVQRGFERLFRDLYELLKHDLDITLFKGGGETTGRERVIFNLSRDGWFSKLLPVHRLIGRNPYFTECYSYALAAYPAILRGKFDIVHYIDLPVGQMLGRLRSRFPGNYHLLYTQGVVIEPRYYPPFDFIHHVAPTLYKEAVDYGISEDRMRLIPCGLQASTFQPPVSKRDVRARYGVPEDAFVVLSVNALNRLQKRVDYVIEEMAGLSGNFLFWCDGRVEDESILALAQDRLGPKFRHTCVPSEQVADIYKLADLLVLGSLEESFGLVVAEAMCAGLPVVVHDNAHFRWMVTEKECRVDMRRTGSLREAVERIRNDRPLRSQISAALQEEAVRRFDWKNLRVSHLDLYSQVLKVPKQLPRRARI